MIKKFATQEKTTEICWNIITDQTIGHKFLKKILSSSQVVWYVNSAEGALGLTDPDEFLFRKNKFCGVVSNRTFL